MVKGLLKIFDSYKTFVKTYVLAWLIMILKHLFTTLTLGFQNNNSQFSGSGDVAEAEADVAGFIVIWILSRENKLCFLWSHINPLFHTVLRFLF